MTELGRPFPDGNEEILDDAGLPPWHDQPSGNWPKGEAARYIAEGKGEFLLANQLLHHGLVSLMKRNDVHSFRVEHAEMQGQKMLKVEVKEDATGVEYRLKEMGS